jgi:hypothetical protein
MNKLTEKFIELRERGFLAQLSNKTNGINGNENLFLVSIDAQEMGYPNWCYAEGTGETPEDALNDCLSDWNNKYNENL